MPLPSHQLDAFFAVAETSSFSRAAERLHVTQPALSQRVQHLESEIGKRLFLRGPGGVKLTEAGRRLLRYCQAQRALEAELVSDLAADAGPGIGGVVRIAGFSSVTRSCVVPSLAETFRAHPRLSIEVVVRELPEVESLLLRGAADFAVLDHPIERPDVEHELVGHEELVLVQSTRHRERDDVYLDHEPGDTTTMQFLRRAEKRGQVRLEHVARSFMNDVYGILDGVAHGYGRAVVSRHLLAGVPNVHLVPGFRTTTSPVLVHWFRQPAYTKAHEAVKKALLHGIGRALRG